MKYLLLLTGLFLCAGASADKFKAGELYYNTLDANTCETTTPEEGTYAGHIVVPASVDYGGTTYAVAGIGDNTFVDCVGLTGVELPGSLTSIGAMAFEGCSALTRIDMPDSVTRLGSFAFQGCTALESVVLSEKLDTLELYTFSQCEALEHIDLPQSVTVLGDCVFRGCTALKSVGMPASLTTIGEGVFYRCPALTDIVLPAAVDSISDMVFRHCTGLTSIYSYAVEPPKLGEMNFEAEDYARITLYVPAGSLAAYRSAEGWKDFLAIEEIEATGIGGRPVADSRRADAVFDLQGRRLSAPRAGLTIINGKKVMTK